MKLLEGGGEGGFFFLEENGYLIIMDDWSKEGLRDRMTIQRPLNLYVPPQQPFFSLYLLEDALFFLLKLGGVKYTRPTKTLSLTSHEERNRPGQHGPRVRGLEVYILQPRARRKKVSAIYHISTLKFVETRKMKSVVSSSSIR